MRVMVKTQRWKGSTAGYVAKHMWLTAHYEKEECEHCEKSKDEVSRLEWANISGEHKRDRNDYRVLCPSCHRKMDLKSDHCRNGHPREGNTRHYSGRTICVICAEEAQKRHKEKKYAAN